MPDTEIIDQFKQHERLTEGRLTFILCPHCAALGRPADRDTRFIRLIDESGRTVQLVLCGVCVNTVTGALAANIVQTIADNAMLDAKDKVLSAIEEGLRRV